jgi:hypothetical protein
MQKQFSRNLVIGCFEFSCNKVFRIARNVKLISACITEGLLQIKAQSYHYLKLLRQNSHCIDLGNAI